MTRPDYFKLAEMRKQAQWQPPVDKMDIDIETGSNDIHLHNDTVETLFWDNLSVRLPDKTTGKEKYVLQFIDGDVRAGELVAIMGPSGSGKSTLLNVLAHRPLAAKAKVEGQVLINRAPASSTTFRRAGCYVEQEDSLIGSLTTRETLNFAAKLGLPSTVNAVERKRRIDRLIVSFGLQDQAGTIIGTPIRKGLSGGEKRRVSVASQLITCPKILFLDEPTSGLDSVASYEVMSYLRTVAKKNRIIVIASIHQPSTATFNLFDTIYLLSKGRLCYGGDINSIGTHFERLGYPMPMHVNPAEYLLDLVNVDFADDHTEATARLRHIFEEWSVSSRRPAQTHTRPDFDPSAAQVNILPMTRKSQLLIPFTLLHRNFIKSYRDVVMYGIRIAMYVGLALMMGTVWLRLKTSQEYIQPFINAIFFGSAFMSFMAVAYVPAYLEDRATFIKERANGLYGPASFLVANFLIGIPYLFLISVIFSVITYFLCNFQPTVQAFFTWIMWLFLDLIAAESLVVFVSSIFPVFVIALALTAFANGLWMSVGGFLVSPKVLNVFWKYWARYIDYQSYVFQGMMVNEFSNRNYTCGPIEDITPGQPCQCMYMTEYESECIIAGKGVLKQYDYEAGHTGSWIGILLCIVLGYRLLTWLVLTLKRT